MTPLRSGIVRLVIVALFTVAVAPSFAAQRERPSVRSGTCFRLVGHGTFPRGALAVALQAAQAAARPAARMYGPRPGDDTFPRDIHLYRDTADFARREGQITGGRFRHALAFSAFTYRNAHIALQPSLDDAVFAATELPRLTRRQIAHEAVHLYCFAVVPSFRDHPSWYSEGAAMWIADRVMRERGWSASIEEDPVTATRIAIVQRLYATDRGPKLAQVIGDAVRGLSAEERYALEWMVFTFLMQGDRRHPFVKALDRARRLPPGRDFAARLAAAVVAAFGDRAMEALDPTFARWLAALEPAWEEERPALDVRGPRWTQIAFPDEPAAAWRTAAVEGRRIVFRGRLTFLPGREAEASLLFGSGSRGHLAVVLTADAVELRAFDAGPRRWESIGRARFDPRPTGTAIEFRVTATGQELRIRIDGDPKLARSLGERPVRGRWGVGAAEGAAVVWDGVRVRTAP